MNKIYFFIIFHFAFIFSAQSQALPSGVFPTAGQIISNAPGVSVNSSGGLNVVRAVGSQTANFANGMRVPIANVAKMSVSAAELAAIGSKALKVGSVVGLAALAIPLIADKLGLVTCPPPDFICKAGNPKTAAEIAKEIADAAASKRDPNSDFGYDWQVSGYSSTLSNSPSSSCALMHPNYIYRIQSNGQCAIPEMGSGWYSMKKVQRTDISFLPVSQGEITDPLVGKLAADSGGSGSGGTPTNSEAMIKLLSGSSSPPFTPTSPVEVSAPAIKIPTLHTASQVSNPDGTTSSRVTDSDIVITPRVTGSTAADTQIIYDTRTTNTVRTINNTTNKVDTSTNVQNEVPTSVTETVPSDVVVIPGQQTGIVPEPVIPVTPEAPAKGPDDYSRENTLQAVLQSLSGAGMPTADSVDKNADLDAIKTQRELGGGVVTGITAASMGLANWIPVIPTGTCVNPTIHSHISARAYEVDICKPVSVFAKFINGVICVFCLYGCVQAVQGALKA